jgi:hypothetical protein
MNLKELLQFASSDGKVMVVNEDGEVKGVFLSFEEYQRLAGGATAANTAPFAPDPEKINREILEAQLSDTVDTTNQNLETIQDDQDVVAPHSVIMPTPIKNILHRRAKDLFMNQPYGRQEPPHYDLREEVIDPTFGVPQSNTQPVVETEGDEEIKPNFDDI